MDRSKQIRTRIGKVAAVSCAASLAALTPAVANVITNDFESYTFARDAANYNIDQTFEGWNALADVIDLGVTQIAGCTTVDTTDYTALRDFTGETNATVTGTSTKLTALTNPTWQDFATARADNDYFDHPSYFDPEEQLVYFDAAGFGTNATNHFVLENDVDATDLGDVSLAGADYDPGEGFIAHGPAIYSDSFNLTSTDTISFDWAADSGGDDYKAFGYLLNTATCEQIELLDSTGENSPWTTVTETGIASGTYRFVFIAGTYDQSWGSAAGGLMYIDNVVLPRFIPDTPTAPPPYVGPIANQASVNGANAVVSGERLDQVEKVRIDNREVTFTRNSDGSLSLDLPADIAPGVYDVVFEGPKGVLTAQDLITIDSTPVAQSPTTKYWTTLQPDRGTVKVYAKNVVGVGKVQFFLNDEEIAWIRAESADDPKLRTANGSPYLVRTVKLVEGQKNALEIYVDGVRVERNAYTY